MRKASIVIGANYGDEGKGTVVATQTKHAEGSVLNVLTNGGAQRGHSILTEDGSMTFQHFGSGTYHGADSYYSRFFILNPMQFVKEYNTLIINANYLFCCVFQLRIFQTVDFGNFYDFHIFCHCYYLSFEFYVCSVD